MGKEAIYNVLLMVYIPALNLTDAFYAACVMATAKLPIMITTLTVIILHCLPSVTGSFQSV